MNINMSNNSKNLSGRCDKQLSSFLGLTLEVFKQLKFNRKDGQHLFSVCLFARLVELAFGCKALYVNNAPTGIPILLRSMFEADIDLINSLQDTNYFKHMYVSFLNQKRRFTREVANNSTNPFVSSIAATRNTAKDLEDTETEFQEFRGQGFKTLTVRDRADRAGRLNEYATIYNYLCLDTHNNIKSLEDFHIESRSETDYYVVLFKCENGDVLPAMTTILGILLTQSKAICDFFGIRDIELNSFFQDFDKLKNDLIAHAQYSA